MSMLLIYVKEKGCGWTDTKHNFEQKFKVILAELGNEPIEEFARKACCLFAKKI